ncbi:WAT1-related protein At1g68170-like [Gastrolobium bilobum]|uniref:WAT1-related protein At1g68170-like n=1 Tax=Gastrolobium bilobum TaxID=150636 RepID=UPI002AAF147E|nr:WAT1-related protein At1g68170-like [Gastrolobium bilobum]XP_061353725.1 WAT1-related protein At1g68170-like [Gastrolobium bilobum]
MKGMWDKWKPAVLMAVVQITFAACNILYKLTIYDGMSTIILSAYRLAFAAVTTIPLVLIFERKRPNMTWKVFGLAFLSGLFGGTLFQNLFYGAMTLAPATLVSALYNLIPSITFILAISIGFEKLNWGAAAGKAKVFGTISGLVGAMVLAFYKGIVFDIWPFHFNLYSLLDQTGHENADPGNELLGALSVITSCFCFSVWLIIQAKINEVYPCYYTSIALMCTIGAIQSIIFGLCVERDLNQWKMGWDVRLLTAAYSGIMASGFMIIFVAYCIRVRGPLFASSFNPLMLVLVAIVASLTLDEKLYLGSAIGSVLIVVGLYAVLWGKSKEMQKMTQSNPSETTGDSEATRPLLDP